MAFSIAYSAYLVVASVDAGIALPRQSWSFDSTELALCAGTRESKGNKKEAEGGLSIAGILL